VGMALGGACPVVELAGPQALHGVVQQLGQEAAMLSGEFAATVVLRVPIAPGESIPLSLLLGTPGITVAVASSATEARDLLAASLSASGPVVLFEPRWLLGRPVASGAQVQEALPLGSARVLREGEHCSLFCWGEGVSAARTAANRLSTQGIEAEIIDLRCLQPLDLGLLGERLQRTGRAILVGPLTGLLEAILESAFLHLESPPTSCEARAESIVQAVNTSVFY
jgi:pyruvate dehydrogenase E1 component beta subunit